MTKFGCEYTQEGATFKVWAPAARSVSLVIGESSGARRRISMQSTDDHCFEVRVPDARKGDLYKFALDDAGEFPDPYSRFQPEGPHGPSMVVDRSAYRWSQTQWSGVDLMGQVVYELHIGTFTRAGTFAAAADKLQHLRDVGITLIEVMPIAEFPGRWNWGYDGVNLFAPYHGYGDYDSFKRFVDQAHALGLGVILDVVYNHIGPNGNYLPKFSPYYFSTLHENEWGTPFNTDGEQAKFVRQFLIDNACEWVREFHLDGLRLDASGNVVDSSEPHVLEELTRAVRAAAAPRKVVIIAEDEKQQGSRVRGFESEGFGFDAIWNEDFHHSAYVAATGRRHAYLYDYCGAPQEFVSAFKRGFLYQGQFYQWQKQPRGEPIHAPAAACVAFLDNHDQVANSLRGARLEQLTGRARYRALMTVLMLSPQTPLLFMGQEFAATTPFLYFVDHDAEMNEAVRKGRLQFLSQYPSMASLETAKGLCDPAAEATFVASKLNWDDVQTNAAMLVFTRELIELRKSDPVICKQDWGAIDGAVLSERAFLIRWFDREHGDRLLIVNIGVDAWLDPGPEPLLAPPIGACWSRLWSSERARYGGFGSEHPETERGWYLPGETALLLRESTLSEAMHAAEH